MKCCRHIFFVFWFSFLKHLNSLCGKFHYCGTSPSSICFGENARNVYIFHLKKMFVTKYWYFFTFAQRNQLFLFRMSKK